MVQRKNPQRNILTLIGSKMSNLHSHLSSTWLSPGIACTAIRRTNGALVSVKTLVTLPEISRGKSEINVLNRHGSIDYFDIVTGGRDCDWRFR